MSTPTTKTEIANLANRHLKNDTVLNIDPPDDSKAAASMAAFYDQARRSVLEDHPWNFASKRITITAEVEEPEFEYTKKYQLPPDFIRVNRIGEKWDDPELDYEIEDGYILCDVESPLKLVYVYNLTDVAKFSPKFITAFSYKLAQFTAHDITGNPAVIAAMSAEYDKEIAQAASVDGQNRPTRRIQRSRIADARRNNGRFKNWQSWGSD